MSATLESDLFSRYFAMSVRGNLEGAPVVSVEGKGFPVQEIYLEDLIGIPLAVSCFSFNNII